MTATTRRRGHRARKGEGGLLREHILDAAEELLLRHGHIGDVSVRAIAHLVGVTPPALYMHFEDKDRLFYAVCRRSFDDFAQRLEPIMTSDSPALERIRRIAEEYVRFGLEHGHQYPILFGVKGEIVVPESEIADDPGLRILNGLIALVTQAQADGEIRSDHPAATVASMLWAAGHGVVSLLIASQSNPQLVPLPPIEDLVEATIETLIRGLDPVACGEAG